jgi:hypothetical protein
MYRLYTYIYKGPTSTTAKYSTSVYSESLRGFSLNENLHIDGYYCRVITSMYICYRIGIGAILYWFTYVCFG